MLPELRTGGGVEASENAERRNEIDFAADDDGRGDFRDLLVVLPGDVRMGHIAAAVNTNGPKLRLHVAGADIDESAMKDGSRDDGVAVAHVDAPQLAAGERVVGDEPLSAGDDGLAGDFIGRQECLP